MLAGEVRAIWIDSWHRGLQSKGEISAVVKDLRAAHINTAFVEVRRRGETLYKNTIESQIELQEEFDPLEYFIKLAHDTNVGPAIEVHAWFVTYPIATKAPKTTNHPFHKHHDWLSQTRNGEIFAETEHAFDPGHPAVQKYLKDLVLDLVKRYEIDGIHFDYIRYEGREWGYNPVSVDRFKKIFHRSEIPPYGDPLWEQFRRDQITLWLRNVYLSSISLKPALKISASTVTRTASLSAGGQWTNSIPYAYLLQDWRSWMEEGLVDMNVPMAFFRNSMPQSANEYRGWLEFIKQNCFGRETVIGLASWLNSPAHVISQVETAKEVLGSRFTGIALYSYASPTPPPVQTFRDLIASSNFLQRIASESNAPPAVMPWKTQPRTGHLKGFVFQSGTSNNIDGAVIKLNGLRKKSITSDATGFYGAVDLPPGEYTISAEFEGHQSPHSTIHINVGRVAEADIRIEIKDQAIRTESQP